MKYRVFVRAVAYSHVDVEAGSKEEAVARAMDQSMPSPVFIDTLKTNDWDPTSEPIHLDGEPIEDAVTELE